VIIIQNKEESQLERELKTYKLIAVISIILNGILTAILIGSYILPWGYF